MAQVIAGEALTIKNIHQVKVDTEQMLIYENVNLLSTQFENYHQIL